MTKLLQFRERFVEEYPKDFHGTKAALRAGYAKNSAAQQASRLLKDDKIQAALKKEIENRRHRVEVSQDAIIHELANLGFSNVMDFVKIDENGLPVVNLKDMTRDQAAAIASVTIEQRPGDDEAVKATLKVSDKKASLELLGKHLGMFNEKLQLSGPDGGPIEVATPDSVDLARRLAFILAKAQKDQEVASG